MCWMLMLCTDRRAVSDAKLKSQHAKEEPDMEMYLSATWLYIGSDSRAVRVCFGWISVDS